MSVKEMIIRQNDILKERNLYLSDYKFCSMAQDRKEQVQAVRTTRLFLGDRGSTLWLEQWEQSSNYEVEETERNGEVAHCVHRKETTEESSRVQITALVLCNCAFKVSYGITCCHHLAINGSFTL